MTKFSTSLARYLIGMEVCGSYTIGRTILSVYLVWQGFVKAEKSGRI
jgi:hypothetical protein